MNLGNCNSYADGYGFNKNMGNPIHVNGSVFFLKKIIQIKLLFFFYNILMKLVILFIMNILGNIDIISLMITMKKMKSLL